MQVMWRRYVQGVTQNTTVSVLLEEHQKLKGFELHCVLFRVGSYNTTVTIGPLEQKHSKRNAPESGQGMAKIVALHKPRKLSYSELEIYGPMTLAKATTNFSTKRSSLLLSS
jgi:hypothetical protein